MTQPPLRHDLDLLPRYAAGRPSTPGGFKLSSNEMPTAPVAAVSGFAGVDDAHRYPDVTNRALVCALAVELGVEPSDVVVGGGSIAVLQQLLQATVVPGDAVVHAWRSYEAYPILVRVAHARSVPVRLADQTHDLVAMADTVLRTGAATVIICNPNNPTGTAVGRRELEQFLDGVPPTCLVVLDEAYREFVTDPTVPDGLELAGGRPNVVVLRTFSKAHALAGLRVGYAMGPARIMDAVRAVALPFSVSSVAETAAIAALGAWPEQKALVADVCRRRDDLQSRLSALGIGVPRSQANFIWLPESTIPAGLADALEESGVSVRWFPGDGVRITIGEPEAIARVIAAAESCLTSPV